MISVSNEKEFIALYEEYFDRIYNYVRRSVPNREVAEDIASNVFVNALEFIKKRKTVIKNFPAWIYKIASNELIFYHKYNRRVKKISMEQMELDTGQPLANGSRNPLDKYADFMVVKQAMHKLKPKERILIQMHFFENMNYEEMGEILAMNQNTLRSSMHRAMKKLTGLLKTRLDKV
jgi:RNA polymerase sigma-70 factor (ECF subfamily)